MWHDGSLHRFYRIGELARALGRSSETIRRWERYGWLPRPPRTGTASNVRGQRRAYPADFAEAVVDIAEEEGIIGRKVASFSRTKFADRVMALPQDWEQG